MASPCSSWRELRGCRSGALLSSQHLAWEGAAKLGERWVSLPADPSRCSQDWGWAGHMEENLCEQG